MKTYLDWNCVEYCTHQSMYRVPPTYLPLSSFLPPSLPSPCLLPPSLPPPILVFTLCWTFIGDSLLILLKPCVYNRAGDAIIHAGTRVFFCLCIGSGGNPVSAFWYLTNWVGLSYSCPSLLIKFWPQFRSCRPFQDHEWIGIQATSVLFTLSNLL